MKGGRLTCRRWKRKGGVGFVDGERERREKVIVHGSRGGRGEAHARRRSGRGWVRLFRPKGEKGWLGCVEVVASYVV